MKNRIYLIIIGLVTTLTLADNIDEYLKNRQKIIETEESNILGLNIKFCEKEEKVNKYIMYLKLTEYDEGFKNPAKFAPSNHFFHTRMDIEKSKLFNLIKLMPKGSLLHTHDSSLAHEDYMYNLTFSDKLYGCTENNRLKLKFFNQPDSTCNWKLLKDLRNENDSYDSYVKSQISLVVPDPHKTYPHINAVWTTFLDIFATVGPMLTYKPVWKAYFYEGLKELFEDNVLYVEFRSILPCCYDLDGTVYGPIEVVGFYVEALNQFKTDYPDFQGARLIYAPVRSVTNETVDFYVQTMLALKKTYPDFVAGFDLVSQEDMGRPLIEFVTQLNKLKEAGIEFFFHAGETDWYGTSTDFNLIDAVLLGTKRIGHGFALMKHPEVLKIVKSHGIGIEISPISNQVLKLVDDLRNHPGNYLISQGYPVIICNDDPCFWGSKGLSYDWYQAFMGMTSRNADLRFLKQLALNSYEYNAMPPKEKSEGIQGFLARWDDFIDKAVKCIYGH